MRMPKGREGLPSPEDPVVTEDAAVFGRNYFNRPSAPEVESLEEANERARVLADAMALKKAAVDYMHPEIGVKSADGACFGRNYFNRASAPESEDDEFADERAKILADALTLNKSAIDYLHPDRLESRRLTEPALTEDVEEANERAQILVDALALKKSAVNYMHPEVGVTVEDSTVFGRNYFNRASAPDTEDDEFADEHADVLALKKAAIDYLHPEIGVKTTDATLFGRNYSLATLLLMSCLWRMPTRGLLCLLMPWLSRSLPLIGVSTEDATLFGRNYFSRASAPDVESVEEANERAQILSDALALKKSAIGYLHPEVGVTSSDGACFGRNYFNRASAPETGEADECAQILADVMALKKSAVNYLHPEIGVTATDGACFGRNYFTRYSAPSVEVEPMKASPEQQDLTGDLSKLAAAVKGANLPGIKSAKFSSVDSDLGAAKKSASSVNLFGLSEEIM
ncbi:hypothetical protein ACHAXN_000682 [Cyclotella atomus]